MQVTHVSDHVTHAVINAGEQLGFGVSDDPLFFQMMSSGLYSNPMRAAVREPLCNAWDANIDNGKADTPLEVTLTESQLTIKDSGKGIPHDMIQPIYLIYGKSSKVAMKDQTGGFGLGCKAPFSYADHFEVRSSFNGICTIYRMVKESLEHGGRPAAVVIASFPTQETGISVTIPLGNTYLNAAGEPVSRDYDKIKRYMMDTIVQGGILAKVNGTLIPTLPLEPIPGNWIIGSNLGLNGGYIFIRYGSVIYPVHELEGLTQYHQVLHTVTQFHGNGLDILFQAPPDSIVIPPNRESISQHEKTVNTINEMFKNFVEHYDKSTDKIPVVELQATLRNIKNAKEISANTLMMNEIKRFMPKSDLMGEDGYVHGNIVIRNTDDIVKMELRSKTRPWSQIRHYLVERLCNKELHARGIFDHQMMQMMNSRRVQAGRYDTLAEVFERNIYHPLLKRLVRFDMKPQNLFIYNPNSYYANKCIRPINEYHLREDRSLAKTARKILILTYSKSEINDGALIKKYSILQTDNGGMSGAFIYVMKRSGGEGARVRQLAAKLHDYKIIDLTIEQDEMFARMAKQRAEAAAEARKARTVAGVPAAPKLVGMPSLVSGYRPNGFLYKEVTSKSESRVENPSFWLDKPDFERREDKDRISFCVSSRDSAYILKPYLQQGILNNCKAHALYIEKHQLPEFQEFLIADLERRVAGNKSLTGRMTTDYRMIRDQFPERKLSLLSTAQRRLYTLMIEDKEFRKEFGIKPETMHHKTLELMTYILRLAESDYYQNGPLKDRLGVLCDQIRKLTPDPQAVALFDTIRKCPEAVFLDTSTIAEMLEHGDKGIRQRARKFVMDILTSY